MPFNQQPREGPMDSFMRAFQMGMQLKQQREALEMEKQDRALRIEALQQEAKRLKLQDKMQAFQLLRGQRGPVTQQPGPEMPVLFSPGGQMGVQGPPTEVEGQHPEFDFSEIQPGLKLRPSNMSDLLAEQARQRQAELAAKIAETRGVEGAKAEISRQPIPIRLPDGREFMVPAAIADQFATGLMTGQNQAAGREFDAEQKALDRANRLQAAQISASGQAIPIDTVDERGNPVTKVMPKGQAMGRTFAKPDPSNKPLSGETASRLAVVDTAVKVADQLKTKLNPKTLSRAKMGKIYAGLDPQINRLIDDLVDADIRVRTGAAANPTEIKTRRAQIIRGMDLVTGDTSSMMAAIDRMRAQALQVRAGIKPGQRQAPGAPSEADPLGLGF